jgi:hypothetical protein
MLEMNQLELEEAHLREREVEKQDAIAALEKALASIEQDQREPDRWERFHLVEAIGAIFRGAYGSGQAELRRARTPPERRGTSPELPKDPLYDQCNIALLRDALREVKAEPVRRYVHHGPVVFARGLPKS